MTKFVSSDTAPPVVRRTRAINKWLAAEANNEATNERLLTVDPEYNILPRVCYRTFIKKAQDIILGIIGEIVPERALIGSFSGGASTSRQRTSAHPSGKYVGEAHVTQRALDFGESLIGDSTQDLWLRLRGDNSLTVVPGNVLFTVPKNADIDRCACKEPDINMYLQKGAGDFIRNRLRSVGIDLNDQSRNSSLARQGSIDASLATIDLSSASDSITTELIFQLLPIHWYVWLDTLRSQITIIDGETHVNEMFSSMGNGFTFELESLIFYAVARAVAYFTGTSGVLSVYGDDIIVPTEMCQDLMSVLSFLGFEPNKDKTFFEGPIRESCGGHYYNGLDITPFYIRKPISKLVDCILLANQIRKWGIIEGLEIIDCEVEDAWSFLASFVPRRLWGGHDFGDTGRLVSSWQPSSCHSLRSCTSSRDTGVGGYLYWHDSGTRRSDRGLSFSSHYLTGSSYRSKPIRWPTMVTRYEFLSELNPDGTKP